MCRGLRFRSLPTTVLTTSVSGSGKGRGGGRVWGNPQAERSVSAAMSTPGSVAPEVAFDPATPPVVEGFSPTPHRLRDESVKDKFQRKVRENPVVPIGCLATAGALCYGLYCFHQGNSKKSQLMMRTRIVAQGFTVMAILGGLVVSAMKSPRLH
ncbi:HIG1 domain family member 2A, mitochondrial [Phascolarctos cinereus]|uniref:HIG1 domain family member 2A, mitochondrial isoform X1 n=1 Tax=Phascolarctos cinereus TaxID=38626 RepID=A0A6P5LFD0_PHACI|nr:HIG1 domain family member 2A, mitochondrial isoform X1 [Phascolarctos cinereus]